MPLLKKKKSWPFCAEQLQTYIKLAFFGQDFGEVVLKQLDVYLHENNVGDKFQSGFRKGHSTETALIKVVNDLRVNMDHKNISILMLLDLSAAIDTVDHNILLDRLNNWIGLSAKALSWFHTYLTGRCSSGSHSWTLIVFFVYAATWKTHLWSRS